MNSRSRPVRSASSMNRARSAVTSVSPSLNPGRNDDPTVTSGRNARARFAELLRGGRYSGSLSYDDVLRIANASRGSDEFGYRSEFVELVQAAKSARTMAHLER